jgi:hypothetical protein
MLQVGQSRESSKTLPMPLKIVFTTIFFGLVAAWFVPSDAQFIPPNGSCVTSGYYQDRVFLCGEVNADMLAIAEEHLEPRGEDTVFIDSLGGSAHVSNQIAMLIIRNRSNVIVGRRCYSACASFLLLVENVTVLPWTEIGFHHNQIAYHHLKPVFDDSGGRYDWRALDAVGRYTRFLADLTNADTRILVEAFDQLEVECHIQPIIIDVESEAALVGFTYRSKFKFWVPTRQQINNARGSPIQGWWPDSWLEVAMSVFETSTTNGIFDFAFGSREQRTDSATELVNSCD